MNFFKHLSILFCLILFSCMPESSVITVEQAFEKAELNRNLGNHSQAFDEYLYAAELGHRDSMVKVAQYYEGQYLPMDLAKAYYWFEKAATPVGTEPGNAYAQYNLGYYNVEGHGKPVDYDKALYWYRLAAEQGETNAMYDLGTIYKNGEGVEVDHEEALNWFKRSATAGDGYAQYGLALEYLEGDIVKADETEAKVWLFLAVKNNVPPAFSALAQLYLREGIVVNEQEARAIALLRRGVDLGDRNSKVIWDSLELSDIENSSNSRISLDELLEQLK